MLALPAKKTVSLLGALLFIATSLAGQPQLTAATAKRRSFARTLSFYESISSRNFNCELQPIVPTVQDEFEENILIEIPSDKSKVSTNRITTVNFAFTQDFFAASPEFIFEFADYLTQKKLPFTTVILLSADSDYDTVPQKPSVSGGTRVFAQSCYEADKICSVVVTDSKYNDGTITAGGAGDISPKWLVQKIKAACASYKKSAKLPVAFMYLYRQKAIKENQRVAAFLEHGIPAAGLYLGHEESDLMVLKTLAQDFSDSRGGLWDRHYSYIPTGKNGIWTDEFFFAATFIAFAFITLLSLCFSSFTNSEGNKKLLRELSRTWYFIPAFILGTSVALILVQAALSAFNAGAQLFFAIKITAVTFLASIFLVYQLAFRTRLTLVSTSYQILIVAALNIFIMTAADLSFMFIFFVQYIIIFFFRKRKSLAANIVCLVLLVIPLASFMYDILRYSDYENLAKTMKTGFWGNVTISSIMFPILIQTTRVVISLKAIKKSDPKKTLLSKCAISVASYTAAAVLLIAFIILCAKASSSSTDKASLPAVINSSETNAFEAQITETDLMDMNTKTVRITSSRNVIRYTVTVKSRETIPLYECNYNYSIENNENAVIQIPDFPPQKIDIVYTTDKNKSEQVIITAYIQSERNYIIAETKILDTGNRNE